jgi:hypothetical protein
MESKNMNITTFELGWPFFEAPVVDVRPDESQIEEVAEDFGRDGQPSDFPLSDLPNVETEEADASDEEDDPPGKNDRKWARTEPGDIRIIKTGCPTFSGFSKAAGIHFST